jgi:Family of unknown function (DUF5681)
VLVIVFPGEASTGNREACRRAPLRTAALRENYMPKKSGNPGGRPFAPGKSGNPGGRPKGAIEVRDLARMHTDDAINRLVEIMEKGKSESAIVMADGNRLRSRASLGPPARSTSIVKWRGSGQNLLKTQQFFGVVLRLGSEVLPGSDTKFI